MLFDKTFGICQSNIIFMQFDNLKAIFNPHKLFYKKISYSNKRRQLSVLPTELVNNINFNDSYVNNIIFLNGTIIININLCMWKQKGYKENDPELKEVNIIFSDVTNYNWNSNKRKEDIFYDTIIEIKAEDNKITVILEDEELLKVSEVTVLSFECTEIQLNYITN